MKPFPEQHELIGLFESEPTLTDAGIPWAYNLLRFTRTIGTSSIECVIEPGYEVLHFRWVQSGIEVVNLDLRSVSGLTIECGSGRETLVAHYREGLGVKPVRIQISPTVHISWGTTQDLI